MTVIVGLVTENKLWIAGDRLASTNYMKYYPEQPKVFTKKKKFVYGCSGSFRSIDFLHHRFKEPKKPKKMEFEEYMKSIYVEALYEAYQSSDIPLDEDGDQPDFIVGYGDALYKVQNDFSLLRFESFVSVGSGSEFAIGAMAVLNDVRPKERLIRTIEAVSMYNPFVGGEIDVVGVERKC